jgi:hypothetical protein
MVTLYGKTCEVGHPCKSATCHSWPHFYETSKVLWYYTWSLLPNLAILCWILATVSNLVLCFLYNFNLPMLAKLGVVQFLCHTVHGPKSSIISRINCCPPNLHSFFTSTDNRLEVSNRKWLLYLKFLFIDCIMYLPSNLTTCLSTLNWTFA